MFGLAGLYHAPKTLPWQEVLRAAQLELGYQLVHAQWHGPTLCKSEAVWPCVDKMVGLHGAKTGRQLEDGALKSLVFDSGAFSTQQAGSDTGLQRCGQMAHLRDGSVRRDGVEVFIVSSGI